MAIQILSETVAAQIAAGEVVERPASVVKELLENALDAGAGSVSVEVRDGGRRLIRVSDDGCGIPAEEVAIAFYRHSTSKLSSAADLAAIQTLGFRGEALASIASVAQVTMVTRTREARAGSRIRMEGGKIMEQEQVGAPQGTVVGVENLFFNVPARLEFLRSTVTEKRHISALVSRYAMAYPGVRFRLVQDGRLVFGSSGNGALQEVITEVLGLDTARQMVAVGEGEPDTEGVKVWGYTSAPALSRSNRSQITLFVNGRWVQDQGLTYAVVQAYHTLLMTGRYPVAVVMVRVPPAEVDVNIHPTKAEVRFRDKDAVFREVQRLVRRAVVDARVGRPAELPPAGSAGEGWMTAARPALRTALGALWPEGHVQSEMALPGEASAGPGRGEFALPVSPTAEGDRRLPMLRVVGQVGAAYIVAEGPGELVVIDQHAAHERILYERFMAERESGVPSQALLEPIAVDLAPDRAVLLEATLANLAGLGFAVEHFGGSTFMVRGLPALLGEISPAAALEAVTDDLEREKKPLEGKVEEQIITRVCKRAAVKAGQVLTLQEMQAMVRQLEACASPHTCPHGRPTMIRLTAGDLARQFGRV